ncbi:MAG: DUF5979 domain-containing protein [Pseudolabrys sp.]
MLKIIARLLPLLLLAQIPNGTASAQQSGQLPILKLGDAVVTGFSGTIAPDPAKPLPRNKSEVDLTFINPDGPSVRIVDVGKPGYVWDGRLFQAPKTLDVFAKDVGQVFGVALDDAERPNIYVAATSVFGLNIVKRGPDGHPERMKKGGPGAGWMKGQFGLDLQGGPGGIYKIDGRTGVATLFANVTLDGVPNPGPGLGNLAYDAAHKQLFVSDLYTGMIHRFDLDGKELSRYDHGVTGLTAAKLAPVAFDQKNRPNIANARFDSDKPDTWGFAPAARRVWGLAVHDGRLYYSVVSGPQIWSVGIARDGSFAADPRWELDVPAQAGPLPISDIAFSNKGAMILAQRALIAASYDYSAFTRPGEPQVFRVWLKGPQDPPSPGRWKPVPEEYSVGFAGNYRNTNGGVALGYGYGQDGALEPQACEAALWTTGQNLRNNPALRSQLEPGGPLVVHGLQGNPSELVRRGSDDAPATSYFVDYDDTFNDPQAAGHMGSVRIYTTPCAAVAQIAPVAPMTPIATPIGTSPKACTPTCVCPPGTVLEGKECVKIKICPPGTVMKDGKCVPILKSDITCKPPMIQIIGGPCVCPQGTVLVDGQCVPQTTACTPPLVLDPVTKTCVCPQGTVRQGRQCVPQACPATMIQGPCECPEGTVKEDGICVPVKKVDLGIKKTGGTTPACPVPYYDFTIAVTNGPDPWPGTGNIVVTDTVPANMTFGPINSPPWSCPPGIIPSGTSFTCTWMGAPVTANQALPVITIPATATIGPPFPPYINCASVTIPSSSGYVDSNPANNNVCTLPVVKPSSCDQNGSLVVSKAVKSNSPLAVPPMTFPVTVTCGGTVTNLTLSSDGTPQTVSNVPLNTACTVQEGSFTTPPNVCPPNMNPVWTTTYTPASPVTVTGANTPEKITNILDCEPNKRDGQLSVTKRLASDPRGIGSSMSFTITAQCTNPTGTHSVTIPANTSSVPFNVPIGSICTFTEVQPTLPAGCSWLPPVSTSVTIHGGLNQTTVTNTYQCGGCPPPQTMNVDNICVCPNGQFPVGGACGPTPPACVPPLVMIPGVGCRCPSDEVLVGNECVKPIVCQPPQVPNATNTGCGCPGNEVLRRGKCVEPEKPKRIKCPRGTELKDGECTKPKRELHVDPNDVIRGLQLIPGLRGGGGGGGSGGAVTPGKR